MIDRKSGTRAILVSSFIVGLAGCASSAGTESEEAFTRTVVSLEADGTTKVQEQRISRSEQLAALAAREQAAFHPEAPATPKHVTEPRVQTLPIGRDSTCALASLWIFDQPNHTGNEICFTGVGTAQLGDYSRWVCDRSWRCTRLTWYHATASYWPGMGDGSFQGRAGEFSGTEPFKAGSGRVDAAGPWARDSYAVTLSN